MQTLLDQSLAFQDRDTDLHQSFVTVGSMFAGSQIYEIPPYQREYQWDPPRWQGLWQDLGLMLDRRAGSESPPNHFLGILLIDPLPAQGLGRSARYSVIDGQQRLVTLLLLLAAIRDVDRETRQVSLPAQHALYWARDSGNEVEGRRLVAQEADAASLDRAMQDGWRAWYKTVHRRKELDERLTLYGYAYFRWLLWRGKSSFAADEDELPIYRARHHQRGASVEEVWVDAGYSASAADDRIDLTLLDSVVRDHLELLVLTLQPTDEDAPTIFESINAKRTELQQWDFIRNLIFTRLEHRQAGALFDRSWKEVQGELELVKYEGKRTNGRDAFVYDYLISRGESSPQGTIGKTRGFEHLRRRMARVLPPTSDPQYRQQLERFVEDDFLSAARCWPVAVGTRDRCLDAQADPLPTKARETIESISKLSAGPPFPAVLHFVEGWRGSSITDEQLTSALLLLETFLARMVLVKRPLSPLRAVFMKLMSQIVPSHDPNTLAEALIGTKSSPGPLPEDSELQDEPPQRGLLQRGIGRGPARGAFRAIERQMSGAAAHPLPYGSGDDDMTVEHVFPQSCVEPPHGTWGADLEAWGVTGSDVAPLVNRLGNLTLLTFRANRYLKARDFEAKRKVFENRDPICPHPILSISQSITANLAWTPGAINDRTELLASKIMERWPFPA